MKKENEIPIWFKGLVGSLLVGAILMLLYLIYG